MSKAVIVTPVLRVSLLSCDGLFAHRMITIMCLQDATQVNWQLCNIHLGRKLL
jgi:hypothetical protein